MSAALGCTLSLASATTTSATQADFQGHPPSAEVRDVAARILQSQDHHGQPFAIIDKAQARLYIFQPQGKLQGASPVLLGSARGDDSVPGIGHRKIADILPKERTTPAGRFVVEPGHNVQGEDIFWVDYENAISMHRVRATNPAERRLQRLASASAKDKRISYGCINVPVIFFNQVVIPTFRGRHGVVYILPETRPSSVVFSTFYHPKSSKPGS